MDFQELWNKHQHDYFETYLRPNNREFWYGKGPFNGYRMFMISSALLHEVIEFQRELPWKWFKTPKELDKEKIEDEISDLWHFLVQLSMEAGLSLDDIIRNYNNKLDKNIQRQIEKY